MFIQEIVKKNHKYEVRNEEHKETCAKRRYRTNKKFERVQDEQRKLEISILYPLLLFFCVLYLHLS